MLIHYYYLILRLQEVFINCHWILRPVQVLVTCPQNILYSKKSTFKSSVAFSCHRSLIYFNIDPFLSISFTFMTLTVVFFFFFNTGWLFCRMFLSWNLSEFSHTQIQVLQLWQEYHRSDAILFSLHPIRWQKILNSFENFTEAPVSKQEITESRWLK